MDNTVNQDGKKFEKGSAYSVPTEQPNYIMVRSIFEKGIPYVDSIFYDASTWSIVHAYNLPYAEMTSVPTKGKLITAPLKKTLKAIEKSNYAYLIELTDYNAHKALYQLQDAGAIVQTSFKPFTLKIADTEKSFHVRYFNHSCQFAKNIRAIVCTV